MTAHMQIKKVADAKQIQFAWPNGFVLFTCAGTVVVRQSLAHS